MHFLFPFCHFEGLLTINSIISDHSKGVDFYAPHVLPSLIYLLSDPLKDDQEIHPQSIFIERCIHTESTGSKL